MPAKGSMEKKGGKPLKIDFHVHSRFSLDGDMTVDELLKRAKASGLDGVAVTDHNSIRGGNEALKRRDLGLIVFAGSEINTSKGEVIGLNIREDIRPGLAPEETCRLIKDQGGFIIIPHPFDIFRKGLGKRISDVLDYIDAVEVFNSRSMVRGFNRKAMDFARKHGLPGVASSDSHFPGELGSSYTIVYSERDKKKILDNVRKGNTGIITNGTGIRPHLQTFKKNVRNRL